MQCETEIPSHEAESILKRRRAIEQTEALKATQEALLARLQEQIAATKRELQLSQSNLDRYYKPKREMNTLLATVTKQVHGCGDHGSIPCIRCKVATCHTTPKKRFCNCTASIMPEWTEYGTAQDCERWEERFGAISRILHLLHTPNDDRYILSFLSCQERIDGYKMLAQWAGMLPNNSTNTHYGSIAFRADTAPGMAVYSEGFTIGSERWYVLSSVLALVITQTLHRRMIRVEAAASVAHSGRPGSATIEASNKIHAITANGKYFTGSTVVAHAGSDN